MVRRLFIFCVAALALSGPVLAREGTDAGRRDLWCGLALEQAVGELPARPTERQRAVIPHYAAGAQVLLERAAAAYRGRGYGTERFAALRAEQAEAVAAALAGGGPVPFSFEDCAALLAP